MSRDIDIDKLIESLDKRIEWRRHNHTDPHNIDTGVIAALIEVLNAVKESRDE